MATEFTFRITLACLLFAMSAVRFYYHLQAGTPREPLIGERESYDNGARRLLWGWLLMASFLIFIFFPNWLSWSWVPLPEVVRWMGLGVGVLGLLLLVWVQHTLGKQFSATLQVRQNHDLVVTGPYRSVRHPMYTALILLWFGLSLISANWLIILWVIVGALGIIRDRAPLEEAMMLETFGDTYREYMRRTGRFLPRWRRRRVAAS